MLEGGAKAPLPARHFVFVKPEQKPKTWRHTAAPYL